MPWTTPKPFALFHANVGLVESSGRHPITGSPATHNSLPLRTPSHQGLPVLVLSLLLSPQVGVTDLLDSRLGVTIGFDVPFFVLLGKDHPLVNVHANPPKPAPATHWFFSL